MSLEQIYEIFISSNGICTDTRKLKKNDLFFSLSGDNFNGNTFAKEAIQKGAIAAIIDDKNYSNDKTITVSDTLKTLQLLANYHRKKLNTTIIALTGSNGKTTTKELINAVLSSSYNTSATLGNLNNHIGVPLTLLKMTPDTEIGIVEMGANHLNEIAELCTIAEPNYGYITNFGKAHLEGFGSLDGVIKGKSELYNYLRKHKQKAFINNNNKTQITQAKNIDSYSFSNNENSNSKIELQQNKKFVSVAYKNSIINSNLVGTYNFTNIAAAISIGEYFKIDENIIKNAIENYTPTNNRSQIIEKNSNQIILDAYNANPTSMKAAIENIHSIETKHKNKTLFIGDMFELGKIAATEHQNIIDYIETLNFNNIYIIGELFSNTKHNNNIKSFNDFKDLKSSFKEKISNNTILIKGSRGMALERILDLL